MPYPGAWFITNGGEIAGNVQGPTTEKMLIIGTAVDGPLNIPVRITDSRQAERVFGPALYGRGYKDPNTSTESGKPNGASLPLAIAEAVAGGCTDIWVVRATGTKAANASAFTGRLNIEAQNPGRIYNEVTVTASGGGGGMLMTIAQPLIKGGSFSSFFAGTVTIGEMIDALNADQRNETIWINRDTFPTYINTLVSLLPTGTAALSGGTNGTDARGEDYETSKDGYAAKLVTTDTGTFDMLLGKRFRFDVCVLTGLYADDQIATSGNAKPNGGGNWAVADEYQVSILEDFVFFLDESYSDAGPCHGVILARPTNLRGESALISYITNSLLATTHAKYDANLRWNKLGPFVYEGWRRNGAEGIKDLGSLLSIVAGPDVILTHPDVGRYTGNFGVIYASMLTALPPEQAATYKALPGVTAYGTTIPAKYAKKLVEGVGFDEASDTGGRGAYVCLTRNPRFYDGPMVVFDDCNAAYRNQIIRQHQIGHVVQSIHKDLEEALGPFIGGSSGPAVQATMDARAQNVLDGYVQSGALRGGRGIGYEVKIHARGNDSAVGIIRVEGELWPAQAIRKIIFNLTVRQ